MNTKTSLPQKHKIQYFKCNSAGLLKEVLNNPGTKILSTPLNVFGKLLAEVGVRCAEINDPILNQLMCDLAIYAEADQYSEDYDKKKVEAVRKEYDAFYQENFKK